jgi:hypothetical protein
MNHPANMPEWRREWLKALSEKSIGDVISRCPRCQEHVFVVKTNRNKLNMKVRLNLQPINTGNDENLQQPILPPYFEHIDDGYWLERGSLQAAQGALHSVHHCPSPHICKWCEQRHLPPEAAWMEEKIKQMQTKIERRNK